MAVTTETWSTYERECGPRRISWGAIIAGTILALVTLFTLSVLGAAIGLTVLEPSKKDPSQALGIGAMVWWVVSSIIALFIGGWAAAKLSAVWTHTNGILHGIVTWALTLVVMGWLLTSAAGSIMGGALSTLQSGIQAGAAAEQGTIQALQQKIEGLAGKAQQEAEEATPQEKEEVAEKAVDTGAAAAWGSFIMLILGAVSGAIGGCVGAHCNKKQIDEGRDTRATTVRT